MDALPDRPAKVEPETLNDTLADVKAMALVDALANNLEEVKAETLGDRERD